MTEADYIDTSALDSALETKRADMETAKVALEAAAQTGGQAYLDAQGDYGTKRQAFIDGATALTFAGAMDLFRPKPVYEMSRQEAFMSWTYFCGFLTHSGLRNAMAGIDLTLVGMQKFFGIDGDQARIDNGDAWKAAEEARVAAKTTPIDLKYPSDACHVAAVRKAEVNSDSVPQSVTDEYRDLVPAQ